MSKKIKLPEMDAEKVCKEIKDFILKQIIKANSSGGIIGLSGGVDSSTSATLTKHAFDEYNQNIDDESKKLKLIAILMPGHTNTKDDELDGLKVIEFLGIKCIKVSIEKINDAFNKELSSILELSQKSQGNLMSRIRANILSTIAEQENKTIIGTGNNDEDFGIGYYTLFGDGAVHMSPIGSLSKRLVRQMALFLKLPDKIVDKVPTAGLEPGQTDFKDLGYSYDLVELVKEGLNQGLSNIELYENENIMKIAKRDIEDYKKHYEKAKFDGIKEMVDDIVARNKLAKLKAQVICPPSPKISLEY